MGHGLLYSGVTKEVSREADNGDIDSSGRSA